jgi:hypothetical protein
LATGKVPVTPVVKGRPVQLVNVPDEGVPKTGVTNVGLVERTVLPEPVEVVTPVPPLRTGKVPVTPVVRGRPVQLVNVPDEGVPKTGVVNVGLVRVLLVRVSVPANVDNVPVVGKVMAVVAVAVRVVAKAPDVVRLPPSVIVLLVFATPVPPLAPGKIPVTPVVKGKPVALVSTPDAGVPSAGVTRVGLVDKTTLPVPVEVVTPVPPLATGSVPVKLDTTLDVTLM